MGPLVIIIVIIIVYIGYKIKSVFEVPPIPKLEQTWWGPGLPKDIDTSIKPFKIDVSDEIIEDLHRRLKNTRALTEPLEGIQQQYGFNTKTLRPILDYWLHEYNWSARQEYLNQFPQFTTNIQGLNIHYLHIKPAVRDDRPVLPIILFHGWAGSVREFYKMIPLLTSIDHGFEFALEVVIPSLPGFAFSDAASKPGLGTLQMALIFKNLMKRIGHERFYVHGGDWGSVIVKIMATLFPENILGLHTTMAGSLSVKAILRLLAGSLWPSLIMPEKFVSHVYPLMSKIPAFVLETGYLHLQATKPDTLGVGIGDSPAGLAAYILEKYSTLTNPLYKEREDAGLLENYTYDELIDNLMLYWVTNSFTTSCRIYAESFSRRQRELRLDDIPIDEMVPCALLRAPNEVSYIPDWILQDKYTNIVQSTDLDDGGHFLSFYMAKVLAEDILKAVSKMREIRKI